MKTYRISQGERAITVEVHADETFHEALDRTTRDKGLDAGDYKLEVQQDGTDAWTPLGLLTITEDQSPIVKKRIRGAI